VDSQARLTLRPEIGAAFRPLLEPARYKGAYGGRGSGKSHFFAQLMIAECCRRQGTRAVCVREVQRTLAQSSKRLLEDKISELGVAELFKSSERQIDTPGGGVILFEGMQSHNADSIKSLEGARLAWVEEAQNLSQRSLDLLRPTIRAEASELWFSWNPDKPTDPVDALLRGETLPPGAVVIEANWDANPWLPDVLRAELEYDRRRDPDKFAHVWQGDYQRHSESRVFKNWKIVDFDVDPKWVLRQGADWGFSVDPSVLVQCAIVGRTLYVIAEAYRVGCEVDFLPDLFRTVADSERWATIADSARPETISFMQRHGFPKMLAAVKGARSLEEGVEFLRSFDILVHPRCRRTADELTAYSYETDPLSGLVIPKLKDKDNHVIDALRYACEGARRAAASNGPTYDFGKSAARGMRV
jgi:phage terminase large subunit